MHTLLQASSIDLNIFYSEEMALNATMPSPEGHESRDFPPQSWVKGFIKTLSLQKKKKKKKKDSVIY